MCITVLSIPPHDSSEGPGLFPARLDTSSFSPVWLSMERRKWLSINAPPDIEACLELGLGCEKLILMARACHDRDLNALLSTTCSLPFTM